MARKRYTIEDMQRIAEERGGKCLSDEYINSQRKLKWQCAEGHIWDTVPNSIIQGTWCRKCRMKQMKKRQKYTIENMKNIAESKGGKCLSDNCVNSHSKLSLQCAQKHIWTAKAYSVVQGRWCNKCGKKATADKLRGNIQDMQRLAEERGGKCLSQEYVDSQTKLEWRCKDGHEWIASPHAVTRGTWCPICSGNTRLNIEEMQNIASGRGGLCLSLEYTNAFTSLQWQCSEGHTWMAKPYNIKNGYWCPVCGGSQRLTLEDMQEEAKKRGGQCLSKEYRNVQTKLRWRCEDGHEWDMRGSDVKYNNGWCPTCQSGIGERFCLEVFQRLFLKTFKQGAKPSWLRNPETKAKMHLDGYCKELEIAFEYHGRQHYEDIGFFQSENYTLEKRKKMDQLKRKLCDNNGVTLIEIPYFICENDEYKKVISYIIQECKKKDIKIPEINLDLYNVKSYDVKSPGKIREMQELAKSHNGEFLSNIYLGTHKKHLWRCVNGHVWENTPSNIKSRNIWCPECSRIEREKTRFKFTIEDMKNIAKNKGGDCLSKEYRGNSIKHEWKCSNNHIWAASPSNIKNGHWCPICARKKQGNSKYTLEDIRTLAEERGGECLSEAYSDCHTKMKFKCSEGHVWETFSSSIRNGHWCPECSGTAKQTIEDMRRIAQERGGVCLSAIYVNGNTKLKWQCSEGHIWNAKPNVVKQGSWCPICFGTKKGTIDEMYNIAIKRGGVCLSTKYTDIKTKLRWRCSKGHEWDARPGDVKRGSWCPNCQGIKKHTIEDIQIIAHERGGVCLSTHYINSKEKLRWCCSKGHEWWAIISSIKRGSWCPICARRDVSKKLKHSIDKFRLIAEAKGGECLSSQYINAHTKLRWRCSEGHEWMATPNSVRKGAWCPDCFNKRRGREKRIGIEEMNRIAREMGGECLSVTYINSKTKLRWRCSEGHEWNATPDSARKRWCKKCTLPSLNKLMKWTIRDCLNLAQERGGTCLSNLYNGYHETLLWQCKYGHTWEATFHNIKGTKSKKGSWCPICAREKRKKK